MFTLAELIDDLTELDYTGVNQVLTAPPRSLPDVTFPALWPRIPALDTEMLTFDGSVSDVTIVLYLTVALQPTGSGPTDNVSYFDTMVTVLDGINTALATLDRSVTYMLSWKIRYAIVELGEHDYHGLVVEVTARAGEQDA